MAVSQASVAALKSMAHGTKKSKARSPHAARSAHTSDILVPRLLFIATTFALVVFGLVMVYSASFVEAFTDPDIQSSSFFFRHQLTLVGVGVIFLLLAAAFDYRNWNTLASWVPWLAITAVLILTLASGNEELGGRRWYDLFGFNFQPSEFAKVGLLLVCSMLLVKLYKGARIKPIALLAALAIGLPLLLILLQPDLGTVIIALAGIIAIAWFGELPMKTLAIAILLAAFVGVAAIMFTNFRMARIDAWLNPWALASDEGYQIINSFYAFADGGILGVGLGMSHQKYLYLPQPHNDLIFPIIGEEFGLIGTLSVVLLFLVFLYASFRIARNAPDFFGRIIAGSAATMIGFQAFLNMLCMANLLPLTGKPLPFFSAGGSSMIVTMILVGLILSVSFRSTADGGANRRREELLIIDGGRMLQKQNNKYNRLAHNEKTAQTATRRPPISASGGNQRKPLTTASGSSQRKPLTTASGSNQRKPLTTVSGGIPHKPSVIASPESGFRVNSARSAQRGNLRNSPSLPNVSHSQKPPIATPKPRYRKPAAGITASTPKPQFRQPPSPRPVNPALKLSPARTQAQHRSPSLQRSTSR
ncbi:MAG: FtsW/RodA/SpoVE family cell cycle protein [Coriobacteriia bacterium]|nr:FtsW/RodA/SpoVE family cell cycle protein [Coriobacteriia bacterium]